MGKNYLEVCSFVLCALTLTYICIY